MKSARIRSFSAPYFPAFGLNTEIYEVDLKDLFSPNAGKYGPEKIRTPTIFKQCLKLYLPLLRRYERQMILIRQKQNLGDEDLLSSAKKCRAFPNLTYRLTSNAKGIHPSRCRATYANTSTEGFYMKIWEQY